MKKMKIGLLVMALSGLMYQSCGNAENTETTNVDSTTMTEDGMQTADNTADGISDAPLQSDADVNTGTGSAATGNGNAGGGSSVTGNGNAGNVNNNGGGQSRTLSGTDDAPVEVQNRGSERDPNKAGVKNPPHIDRHINRDSVNNRTNLGSSR